MDIFRLEDIKSCPSKGVKVTDGLILGLLFKDEYFSNYWLKL